MICLHREDLHEFCTLVVSQESWRSIYRCEETYVQNTVIYVVHISAENSTAKNITFLKAIKKVNPTEFVGFRYTILIVVWCIIHSALLQMCLNYSDSETNSLPSHPPTSHHICINGLLKTFFKIRILLFLRVPKVTMFRSQYWYYLFLCILRFL